MNVIHISTTDVGGAGNVARSLAEELDKRDGINSKLLVSRKKSGSETVEQLPSLPLEKVLNYGIERIVSLDGYAAPSSFWLRRKLQSFDTDVVHLHNLHGSYFNLLTLLSIPTDIKVTWTFHDMWPFTGNCVYAYGCDRFTQSCGSCPQTDAYPSLLVDTTPLLLRLKELVLDRVNVTGITPSKWIQNLAEKSRIPFDTITHIPNSVDTELYRPHDKQTARERFDIPEHSHVILFLANNIDNERKGMIELLAALDRLPNKNTNTLLIIGGGDAEIDVDDDFTVRSPGRIPEAELPLAYSAADLFVIPSLAENFPLTVLEAMACGTPVVGFPSGGITEQIVDGENGWLCPDQSVPGLAETIQRGFDDDYERLGRQARDIVRNRYPVDSIVDQHLSLYRRSGSSVRA